MAVPGDDFAGPAYLRIVPGFLVARRDALVLYILKCWLLVFLPSVALALLVGLAAGLTGTEPATPAIPIEGAAALFLLVIVTPLVETLIMIVPLLVMDRLLGPTPAVIGSATGWAVAHSLHAPIWGLTVWWPFFIFSALMLVWRDRGLSAAIAIVTLVHACQNGAAALLMLAGA